MIVDPYKFGKDKSTLKSEVLPPAII